MYIGKTYTFEAAHHLPNHKGKCRRHHGHSYVLEVELKGYARRDEGMVLDYDDMDEVIEPLVQSLDHYDLNEILPSTHQPPTAENIAAWFWDALSKVWPNTANLRLERVRIKETAKTYAEVRYP